MNSMQKWNFVAQILRKQSNPSYQKTVEVEMKKKTVDWTLHLNVVINESICKQSSLITDLIQPESDLFHYHIFAQKQANEASCARLTVPNSPLDKRSALVNILLYELISYAETVFFKNSITMSVWIVGAGVSNKMYKIR